MPLPPLLPIPAIHARLQNIYPEGTANRIYQTREMEPGPSSVISKAVVEEFAPRFLSQPGVIWLSESRNQIVARDDELAQAIGLRIEPDRNLPDAILVDLGPADPLLVFGEGGIHCL